MISMEILQDFHSSVGESGFYAVERNLETSKRFIHKNEKRLLQKFSLYVET